MRFLLKSAFMIFILLLVVPFFAPLLLGSSATREQQALPSGSDIGGAISAARGTIDYMSGMCDERPEVCTDGAGIMGFLGNRARQGAQIVYLYLGQHFGDKTPEPQTLETTSPKTARPAPSAPEVAGNVPDLIQTGAILGTAAPELTTQQPSRIDEPGQTVPVPTPRPR